MKMSKRYKEVVLYILFGAIVTFANWISYSLLVLTTDLGVTISNFFAWIVAVVLAFITSKFFVFEKKGSGFKRFLSEALSFLGLRVATGVVEVVLPTFLIYIGLNQTLFDIDGFYAKLIVSIIVVILNYILSKFIVFRK